MLLGENKELINKFGEEYNTISEEDPCQMFFTSIATFIRSYRLAMDENIKLRLAEEKKNRLQLESNLRLENKKKGILDSKSTTTSTKGGKIGDGKAIGDVRVINIGLPGVQEDRDVTQIADEDMFGKFHSSQEDSSDNVVQKFRNKLQKR